MNERRYIGVWSSVFGLINNQKSLFSLLWTPQVTGAVALTFFKYQIAAPTPTAPAAETALTVPESTISTHKNHKNENYIHPLIKSPSINIIKVHFFYLQSHEPSYCALQYHDLPHENSPNECYWFPLYFFQSIIWDVFDVYIKKISLC